MRLAKFLHRTQDNIDLSNFNDYYFVELGVVKEAAIELFNVMARTIGLDGEDTDVICRPAWCALKLSGFEPKNILEYGTYKGYSAVFLAMLWPDAQVYTVDLPSTDPLYKKWQVGLESQTPLLRNGTCPNITTILSNTMHIEQTVVKDLMFDLIFLDAQHINPTMSYDHLYCLGKLNSGGWLFSDDVIPPFDIANAKHNAVWETIKYINERQKDQFRFLLQRERSFVEDGRNGRRKYVAFIKRST